MAVEDALRRGSSFRWLLAVGDALCRGSSFQWLLAVGSVPRRGSSRVCLDPRVLDDLREGKTS